MLTNRKNRLTAGSEDGSRATTTISEEEPEPFAEMFSIFRIVAYYEILLHGQWQYVQRFMKNEQTELILGMYIGAAFELIRFVCVLILAIVLILMRIAVIIPFHSEKIIGNIMWISSINSMAFWISLILCALIVTQFAVYQCKNPDRIVISTAFNFMFSIILITTIIHLAVFKSNSEELLKEGFHKGVMKGGKNDGLIAGLNNHEATHKCCGIDGPMDYRNSYMMRYTNPLTNANESVPTTRGFSLNGNIFSSLPISCCRNLKPGAPSCFQRSLTVEEEKEIKAYESGSQWDLMLKFFLLPEPGTYFSRGCLAEYVASADRYATILIVTIVIFTIFTGLTIGFVIVLLLYHDGLGHIVSDHKMFGVERNTGVHFLMSLDMIDTDFQDDFSLIEFLRKTDLDRFMAEDRLKDNIHGRREAEQM